MLMISTIIVVNVMIHLFADDTLVSDSDKGIEVAIQKINNSVNRYFKKYSKEVWRGKEIITAKN